MKFKPYPKYKASGVEWLGDVPENWQLTPVKNIASIVNGYPFDSALFKTDAGFPLIRIRDLNKSVAATRYLGEFVEQAAITSNDVLIGMDGEFNVGRWRGHERALLNQRMCCIRGNTELVTRFLEYAVPLPLQLINDLTYFTTVKHLSSGQVEKLRVAFPTDKELQSLVFFLDRETAKIDTLIAKQGKLIVLLKEKRQTVISDAATKGLDPTVPMKASGVEWLGDVPEHWNVAAVGYRYEVALGKMLDQKKITGNHLAPYLRNTDVQWERINTTALPEMDFGEADRIRYSLRIGDLLVCEGGEVGRAAIWNVSEGEYFYQKALHRMRPYDPKSDVPKFMFYLLATASAQGRFTGSEGRSTIAHLPAEALRAYRFGFPGASEQQAIVAYLEKTAAKIDRLIAKAQQGIALQKEHRTALISAAVTGKIDVRNEVEVKIAA